MKKLLVGFDSAWTAKNFGALVAALVGESGELAELTQPMEADFSRAMAMIKRWRSIHCPSVTLVFIDQPTVVRNFTGQREIEAIACVAVIRRGGCMQPANAGRESMFGLNAPIWEFIRSLDARTSAEPPWGGTFVLETYPTLFFISRGWVLPGLRSVGRLPRYNPSRGKTFSLDDWKFVCSKISENFSDLNLLGLAEWARSAYDLKMPRKKDQDRLDACLCLLAAIEFGCGSNCLVIGDGQRGCLVVPESQVLLEELSRRCDLLGLDSRMWLRVCSVEEASGLGNVSWKLINE